MIPRTVLVVVACAVLLHGVGARLDLGEVPVIAVIGVPALEASDCITLQGRGPAADDVNDGGFSCFLTMYGEWVTGAAGRVVVVPYDMADHAPMLYADLLDSVNGVLITGGGVDFATPTPTPRVAMYLRTVGRAYSRVQEKAAAGVTLPLWGTCMGMQLLSMLGAGGNTSVVQMFQYDSEDLMLPIVPTAAAAGSRLLGSMPRALYETLTQDNVTANLHHDGVDPALFTSLPALRESFKLLAWNVDRKGKPFASVIEHASAPIYATQFHPERPTYETYHTHNNVFNRSYSALMANGWFSHFFIHQARQNTQTFTSAATWAWAEAHSSKNVTTALARGTPLDGDQAYMYTL